MAIQKITIHQFLELAHLYPVLDVRSPGEYSHAHIPGAYSLPLFTDEERKVVGTAYKQQSRETAIKLGLDYFGVKMRDMVEETEKYISNFTLQNKKQETRNEKRETRNVVIYCWRGGMRSAGVAWLLDLYGFKVYTLAGGYKAWRHWAREQFEKEYNLSILGGYTGSGKTLMIHELQRAGHPVIDLEGLANHKGSAFGALGEKEQPSQEMFENNLAHALAGLTASIQHSIWLEDESQRIGALNIPNSFWKQMRKSPVCFLDIPFEERLNYLTEEYGKFAKANLVTSIIRIQKRLGGLETKTAINYLLENNHKECFRILLTYYDKCYAKGLYNRNDLASLLFKIPCATINTKININKLMHEKTIVQ